MTLSPGTRLGAYTVTAHIGSGGMGEVYQATDTNLKRQVALKVLPASVAADAERLARFQREAEVLAALNHPNIAQIYGLEKSEGTTALVMELVEGDDLAARIARGAIPLDEALPIAKQIAEALEAAHEQGIIHRDLKPANIKVRRTRRDGKALDAGTGQPGAPRATALTNSPTLTSPALMTGMGVILGTAAYMSPEQAKGLRVDKRSDVWAFGCVLYEMLTGARAFAGDDVADTLANVLKTEPEWDALSSDTPQAVRDLIERCVRKDPRVRVADVSVVRYVLERPPQLRIPSALPVPASAGPRKIPVLAAAFMTGALAAAGLAWVFAGARPARSQALEVRRFAISLDSSERFQGGGGNHVLALAPDGSRLAYLANGRLYVRALDQLVATPLQATEGASEPFFSPDGQWIGFWQRRQIKKIPVGGGAPVVVGDASNPFGISWADDGTILFAEGNAVFRVADSGGAPELLFRVKDDQSVHGPQLLPGRKAVLYTVRTGVVVGGTWEHAQIAVRSLVSASDRTVLSEGTDARYLPTGHIVFARDGTLLAAAFDSRSQSVSGSAVPLLQGLNLTSGGNSGAIQFATANDGTLSYIPNRAAKRTLVWVDRAGNEDPLFVEPASYYSPRTSPDGTRVAVDDRSSEGEVWVFDLSRQTRTRLTFEPGADVNPQWTPDGQYLIYGNDGVGSLNLFRRRADGAGGPDRLTQSVLTQSPQSVTPDGSHLLFRQQGTDGQSDVYTLDLAGAHAARVLLQTPANEQEAEVSPDGRWLAYKSDESGRNEVYVRPFPNVDSGRWQISVNGGMQVRWSRSGREIFFRGLDGSMMATPVVAGEGFSAGRPVRLFGGSYFTATNTRNYDVSPDGKRFLMVNPVEDPEPAQIVIVEHWFEELKARVATK